MTFTVEVIYKEKHEYTWNPNRIWHNDAINLKPVKSTRVFPHELTFYLLSDTHEYLYPITFEFSMFAPGTNKEVNDWLNENVGKGNRDWKFMPNRQNQKRPKFKGKRILSQKRYLFKTKDNALLFKLRFG